MSDRVFIQSQNRFEFSGTESDFYDTIRNLLSVVKNQDEIRQSEEYARHIFQALFSEGIIKKFNIQLDSDEKVYIERVAPPAKENLLSLIIYKYKYYINLKSTTLALLALLADSYMAKEVGIGGASIVLAMLGVNFRAFARVPDSSGERCVLIETHRKKEGALNIFDDIIGHECVHNNLNCKYKDNGICTISKLDVEKLFDTLVNKNILT